MLRNDNPFRISARMGGTWLVASSTFFGAFKRTFAAGRELKLIVLAAALREYIVTPTLIESRLTPYHDKMYTYLSAKQLGKLPAGPLNLTRGERQMRNVLDSGISGMIVGAVASWAISEATFPIIYCASLFPAYPLTLERSWSKADSKRYNHWICNCVSWSRSRQFGSASQNRGL